MTDDEDDSPRRHRRLHRRSSPSPSEADHTDYADDDGRAEDLSANELFEDEYAEILGDPEADEDELPRDEDQGMF